MSQATVPSSLFHLVNDFLIQCGLSKTQKIFKKECKLEKVCNLMIIKTICSIYIY